ncbi:AAA family ATPase [Mycolicibacterium boenickei]|nr:AAA family ATPase [Mycolicibacterium boenickei]
MSPPGITVINGQHFTPIRGRQDELKVIGAQIDSLLSGNGVVLVIEGAPGIGKSRLVVELLAIAEGAGVRTLVGEAFENQRSIPFFTLFTATLRSDPPVGDIDLLRRLGGSADLGFWVVHELREAIRTAAATAPLVIVLEDIHWADNGTLLALRELAAEQNGPVLWVLTARSGAGGPALPDTLAVLRQANATFMRVAPMPPDALSDMVSDALRANVDESLLTLVAKANGNPFLVGKIVGGLRAEGRLEVAGGRAMATGPELPRNLNSCMKQNLDQLSEGASELVRVAAVLPERFSARLLAGMLERQPALLLSALAEAGRAGLLVEDGDQLRFGHDLLREVARNMLPQSLLRAMERQSVSIMAALGAPPAALAVQLARSAERGDVEAIALLRRAANVTSRTDASGAADLSLRALDLMPVDDAEHGRLVAETVALLNRAARYEESEGLAVEALSRASAEEEAEIRLRLPSFTRRSAKRRAAENRRALELGDISEVTRARHLALLAYNSMLDDVDGDQRAMADEAVAAASASGDMASKIVADLTVTCFNGADGHVCRALEDLRELCALGRTNELPVAHLLASNFYANLLAVVGRLDEAADQVATGIERARQERNTLASDVWETIDGMVHLAAGRLSEARDAAEPLTLPERDDATELDLVRIGVLAQVAVSTDDRNLLQQMATHAHDIYPGAASVVRCRAAHVLALAAWHRGDLSDALRWFSDEIRLLGTLLAPQAVDQLILGARIASATGDAGLRERVRAATDKLRHDAQEIPLFAAVARYVGAILDSDADGLVSATDLLQATSRPLLYAAAAEDAGRKLVQSGRTEEAVRQLIVAFETYSRLGATADARRVAREMKPLGIERRIVSQPRATTGWESLTGSELKVVHLIARGASNRATAEQLHLSLHTVKTHVHNVFAKLEISSRAQLAELTP